MKALLIVGIVVVSLVLVGGAVFLFFMKGPDLSKYELLRNPRISEKKSTRMIEVVFQGKPDEVLQGAFGLLFKTYYALPGAPKGPAQPAPIARFKGIAGLPNDPAERAKALASFSSQDWVGTVGLPVPETVTTLPKAENKTRFEVKLATWEYGEVAEILHIGSYDTEIPTIERLEQYIHDQGYAIAGEHEEEYLRGPGMPMTKPESYYTIIRYPVRKAR
jgi:effector-binding domain-containing protein